jgi:hypothetical protein
MAHFKIDDILHIGGSDKHVWTSWEVYADSEMTQLVDSNMESTTDLLEWITPLKIGPDEWYDGSTWVFGRVKIMWGVKESVWIRVNPCGIDGSTECLGFPFELPLSFPCNAFDRFEEWDEWASD